MARTKGRANGDGDVFPRKNKEEKITSYRGAYFDPDGKRRYVSGKTRIEAREALATARADAACSVVFDAGKLTVAEYLERWLMDYLKPLVAAGKMAHSTYVRYAGIVDRHISPTIGRKKLRDLSRAEVRALYWSRFWAFSRLSRLRSYSTILLTVFFSAIEPQYVGHTNAHSRSPLGKKYALTTRVDQ